MAKAIHWPAQFLQQVLAENTQDRYAAIRLGDLYFVNQYWVPGEQVDIRVNHEVVRAGVVVGELKRCMLGELTADDFACLKPGLQAVEPLQAYLQETYQQPVEATTVLTLVYYRNI